MKLSRGGRLYLQRRSELFSRADLFVCVSEFIRDKAIERGYPKEKLFVHSIGIDLDHFHPNECEHREQMVLFVGRLVEKKGCIHLIRAMETVLQSAPDTRLVVIGDGPLRQQLQKTAKSLLPGHHLFLGAQPTSVIYPWLRRAKVFSVPSVTAANGDAEGLGMVFCEAQAMGVPVVSFASGGIAEAVLHGSTGFLLPEHDEKQLAEKICLLLQDRALWSEMSLRGRKHMAIRFDIKTQTKTIRRGHRSCFIRCAAVAECSSVQSLS
jgi:glycosyltransferase involved in cell wall biosynthesis